ncbi:MAG: redoxin domain-containing protein [Sedimentisphaerales bacterium]|nr:redoxin domain-containing protein [Sedimentisphaerales bacterium]
MSFFIQRCILLIAVLALTSDLQAQQAEQASAPDKKIEKKKTEELIYPEQVKTLKLGQSAPDFNLIGIDGKYHTLKDYDGADVFVVIFTCNHCPTAQAYEDRIIKMVEDYKEKSVGIVAISPNDPKAISLAELGYSDLSDSYIEMRVRARQKGFNFPYLYDGLNQKASAAYGPKTTPHVFVFNKQRKLCFVGRIDDSEKIGTAKVHDTRNAINALLAGKPVPVKETSTIGCSIKWSGKRKYVKEQEDRWAKETATLKPIKADGIQEIMANRTKNLRLVNLWATWCGPCIMEFPDLVDLHRIYRNRNFELVTISLDDPRAKENVNIFLNKYNASCSNYIYDSADQYAVVEAIGNGWTGTMPQTFLIEPGGKIIYDRQGMINPFRTSSKIISFLGRYYQ